MFFRRGLDGAPDPWLRVKMWLFGAGAVVALLGMGFEDRRLIALAGLILAAGLLLRFVPHPRERETERDADLPPTAGDEDR